MAQGPKWKKFERLVAAVHAMEGHGAEVQWGEEIDGRQFDVTVRFKRGHFRFLVVIECKDYSTAVSVDRIDALATKARDAKADKAVMVSSNGFQSGAKEVAKRHNISLLTLKSMNGGAETLAQSLSPVLHLSGFRFVERSEPPHLILFPDEVGVMRSLMRDTIIRTLGNELSPEQLVKNHSGDYQSNATSEIQTYEIILPDDAVMIDSNSKASTPLRSVLFEFALITESDLVPGEYYSDHPSLSEDIMEFRDELNGDMTVIDVSELPHGFDTVITPGKFYFNPHLGFSYYVESVDGDLATYQLVESYQLGRLIQAKYKQKLDYSWQFVEITDPAEIERLQRMLDRLRG